jgi:hypothetical protein
MIAALVMAMAWRPWRQEPAGPRSTWAGALAIGGGFAAAFFGVVRRLPDPKRDVTDVLVIIAVAVMIAGTVDSVFTIPRWIRRLVAAGILATSYWLLLRPLSGMSATSLAGWLASLTLVLSVWWSLLDELANFERGPIVPVLLTIVSGSTAIVLMLSGSKLIGQLAGAVAAAIGGCTAIALFSRAVSLARGGVFATVSLVGAVLLCGYFYASLTVVNGSLLIAAALLTTAGHVALTGIPHGWKRAVAQIALVVVPAGLAVAIAGFEFVRSTSQYSY